MPSSKPEDRAAGLAFDPGAVLVSNAGMLLNARFAKGLYEELSRARGTEQAHVALAQIGCLHGLRDAQRVLGAAFRAPSTLAAAPAAPAVALQVRGLPDARSRGALELSGSWPERAEALARLSHASPTEGPICALSAGYTSGWLSEILEADIAVVETRCTAAGDAACAFVAREVESWRAGTDPRGHAVARTLPLAELRRALAAATPAPEPADEGPEPVVHIWSPVMIIPFEGADETLMAVDLLRSDPTLAEISVVLIDLTDRIADAGFDAAALAGIVEAVDRAGAETVFAGVPPLLEPLVADLEPPPLRVCNDLDAAVAASFLIADSQRRPA